MAEPSALIDHLQRLTQSPASSADPTPALLLLLQLKKATRELYAKVAHVRELEAEDKRETDVLHTETRTAMWERHHLKRELDQCLATPLADSIEFSSPVDDFSTGSMQEQLQKKLNRVKAELEARKQLKLSLDELAKEKNAASATLQENEAILNQLPQNLAAISAAVESLQGFLGNDDMDVLKRHDQVRRLPAPLFIAYCQLESYNTLYGGVKLSVEGFKVTAVLSLAAENSFKLCLGFLPEENKLVIDNPQPPGIFDELFANDPPIKSETKPGLLILKCIQAMGGIYELDPKDQNYRAPSTKEVMSAILSKASLKAERAGGS